ncbi:MAG: hypothetical protein EHM58_05240 [Ignavibacteriae bacterium]|nr:MAG: hypothetical protein EHM58_05240 [Ignavibacteriota bacterium]
MKEYKDIELDLYILNRSLLSAEKIREIEDMISSDEEIRNKVIELEEFYNIFNTLEKKCGKKVIKLETLHQDDIENDRYMLAAQHEENKLNYYEHVRTYVSAEKLTVSRLLQNKFSGEYVLYITNEDSPAANSLAYIPGINKSYIADKNGRVKIKEKFIGSQNVIIKLPEAVFIIKELSGQSLTNNDLALNIKFSGDDVEFQLVPNKVQWFFSAYIIYSEDYSKYEYCKITNNRFRISNKQRKNITIVVFQ